MANDKLVSCPMPLNDRKHLGYKPPDLSRASQCFNASILKSKIVLL